MQRKRSSVAAIPFPVCRWGAPTRTPERLSLKILPSPFGRFGPRSLAYGTAAGIGYFASPRGEPVIPPLPRPALPLLGSIVGSKTFSLARFQLS